MRLRLIAEVQCSGVVTVLKYHRRVAGRVSLVQKDRFSSARLEIVSGVHRLAGRVFAAPREVICDLSPLHPTLV